MSNRTTHIYVLSDGDKYYVGKADNVKERYRQHMSDSFNYGEPHEHLARKINWILSYGSKEMAKYYIGVEVIETITAQDVDDDEWKKIWGEREKTQIANYRDMYGFENVMNDTDGGEGSYNAKWFPTGETNPNSRLTWYDIFLFRYNYIPSSRGNHSRKAWTQKLGVNKRRLGPTFRNETWHDPNWDSERRVYIGPPHGWEESWGSWER